MTSVDKFGHPGYTNSMTTTESLPESEAFVALLKIGMSFYDAKCTCQLWAARGWKGTFGQEITSRYIHKAFVRSTRDAIKSSRPTGRRISPQRLEAHKRYSLGLS